MNLVTRTVHAAIEVFVVDEGDADTDEWTLNRDGIAALLDQLDEVA